MDDSTQANVYSETGTGAERPINAGFATCLL